MVGFNQDAQHLFLRLQRSFPLFFRLILQPLDARIKQPTIATQFYTARTAHVPKDNSRYLLLQHCLFSFPRYFPGIQPRIGKSRLGRGEKGSMLLKLLLLLPLILLLLL
jgi:hypothetical protein